MTAPYEAAVLANDYIMFHFTGQITSIIQFLYKHVTIQISAVFYQKILKLDIPLSFSPWLLFCGLAILSKSYAHQIYKLRARCISIIVTVSKTNHK